jgi:hypothetical protein
VAIMHLWRDAHHNHYCFPRYQPDKQATAQICACLVRIKMYCLGNSQS